MQKIFSHRYRHAHPEKIIYGILFSAFFLGLGAYSYFTGAEIAFKRSFISAPLLFGIGAALTIVMAIFHYIAATKKKRFDKIGTTEIIVREGDFEFVNENGQREVLQYSNIAESSIGTVNQLITYCYLQYTNASGKSKKYTFFRENFANDQEYDEFYSLIKNHVKNSQK